MNENELADIFDSLENNGITNQYSHILTGFIGNESFLKRIGNMVENLKSTKSINYGLLFIVYMNL